MQESTTTTSLAAPTLSPNQYMKTSRVLGELLALANSGGADSDTSEAGRAKSVARRLLSVLHHRDPATVEHSRRVAMICVGISEMLGWNARQRSLLEVAALVHDICKIGVPDHILTKPGKLNSAEYDLIVKYHRVAVTIFQACRSDREFVRMLSQLHDQYSEANEKASGEVHLGARILAVADAYDSLSTAKSFRRGQSHSEIMKLLNDQSGTRYDGNIVRALSRWYEREGEAMLTVDESAISPIPPLLTPEQAGEIHLFGCIFGCLSLIESTYDGLCITDTNQNIVVWTGRAEQLLGRSAEEIIGQRHSTRLIPSKPIDEAATASDNISAVAAVLADGEIRLDKRLIERADGTWIEVEVETVPIVDQHGLCGAAEIYNCTSQSRGRKIARVPRTSNAGIARCTDIRCEPWTA